MFSLAQPRTDPAKLLLNATDTKSVNDCPPKGEAESTTQMNTDHDIPEAKKCIIGGRERENDFAQCVKTKIMKRNRIMTTEKSAISATISSSSQLYCADDPRSIQNRPQPRIEVAGTALCTPRK